MFATIRGVLLAYSKGWRDGKFSPYRKLLLGFPDTPETPQLWCTVWGKENWGYRLNDSGQRVEQRLRRGLILEVTGHLEYAQEERRMSVKSGGSENGGFVVLGEYRKYQIAQILPVEWIYHLDGVWDFQVERDVVLYQGTWVTPLPCLVRAVDGSFMHHERVPERRSTIVVDGNPILISLQPPTWFFDRSSQLLVLSAERI